MEQAAFVREFRAYPDYNASQWDEVRVKHYLLHYSAIEYAAKCTQMHTKMENKFGF